MTERSRLIGAFLSVVSQLRTIDALAALVEVVSAASNSGYDDGFQDGSKSRHPFDPKDQRHDNTD